MYRLFILLLIIGFSCSESVYVPDNELIINTMYFDANKPDPVLLDNYYLVINLMSSVVPSDFQCEYLPLFADTVFTNQIIFTSSDDLRFGRYIISAKKDSLNSALELIYKGGSVQLDLILK